MGVGQRWGPGGHVWRVGVAPGFQRGAESTRTKYVHDLMLIRGNEDRDSEDEVKTRTREGQTDQGQGRGSTQSTNAQGSLSPAMRPPYSQSIPRSPKQMPVVPTTSPLSPPLSPPLSFANSCSAASGAYARCVIARPRNIPQDTPYTLTRAALREVHTYNRGGKVFGK